MPSYNQIVLHMPVARRTTVWIWGSGASFIYQLRKKLHPTTSMWTTTTQHGPCSADKLDLNLPQDADK